MKTISNKISSFFNFAERGATFKKEIIGGISTFLAMAYILAVNPGMLSMANGARDYAGVFFLGTAISAFLGTMLMAVWGKVPVALAPGMGVNAFFTFTVAGPILGLQVENALIATFISGILYAIIAVTPARNYIAKLLPRNMKLAIGAMIGLFLAYIGLVDSGIIVSDSVPMNENFGVAQHGDAYNFTITATKTKLGNFKDPFVIISMVTLLLAFGLHFAKVKGAAILAMLAAVVMVAIAFGAGVQDADKAFVMQDYKEFSKFGDLSSKMWSSIGDSMSNGKFYIAVFVFLYIDFFDTTGTLFSVGEQAGLNTKSGQDKDGWLTRANQVDAASTVLGSMLLTSTTTSYIESSVGISQGAKTGFSSVVVALGFALSIAAWPIMSAIMPIAHSQVGVAVSNTTIMPVTGPILVLVGALMVSQLKHFEWEQAIDIPALFITLVFGMLSYSISTGIAAGIVMHVIVNTVTWLIATIKTKRGKTFLGQDGEIVMTDKAKKIISSIPDLKSRILNPVMLTMFVLALVYFGTMPLWAY